jgi:hypothetical protein
VKHKNVPAPTAYPAADIFRSVNLAGVHVEAIYLALHKIVRPVRTPARLLVPRRDYGVLDGRSDVTERVGVRWNFYSQSLLNPPLGILGFAPRVVISL